MDGRAWQPYADFLVYVALAALPWCGGELQQSAPQELDTLYGRVEAYLVPVLILSCVGPRAGIVRLNALAAAFRSSCVSCYCGREQWADLRNHSCTEMLPAALSLTAAFAHCM